MYTISRQWMLLGANRTLSRAGLGLSGHLEPPRTIAAL